MVRVQRGAGKSRWVGWCHNLSPLNPDIYRLDTRMQVPMRKRGLEGWGFPKWMWPGTRNTDGGRGAHTLGLRGPRPWNLPALYPVSSAWQWQNTDLQSPRTDYRVESLKRTAGIWHDALLTDRTSSGQSEGWESHRMAQGASGHCCPGTARPLVRPTRTAQCV